MTYLDPNHMRTRPTIVKWIVRAIVVLGIIGFGWFALTVGMDDSGRTEIVQEPVSGTL